MLFIKFPFDEKSSALVHGTIENSPMLITIIFWSSPEILPEISASKFYTRQDPSPFFSRPVSRLLWSGLYVDVRYISSFSPHVLHFFRFSGLTLAPHLKYFFRLDFPIECISIGSTFSWLRPLTPSIPNVSYLLTPDSYFTAKLKSSFVVLWESVQSFSWTFVSIIFSENKSWTRHFVWPSNCQHAYRLFIWALFPRNEFFLWIFLCPKSSVQICRINFPSLRLRFESREIYPLATSSLHHPVIEILSQCVFLHWL